LEILEIDQAPESARKKDSSTPDLSSKLEERRIEN
jgi:hypothetical protein